MALLPLQQPWSSAAGWALLLGGSIMLAAALPALPAAEANPLSRRIVALALSAITLLALALRLAGLDALPLGMWRDEARHGLLALRILNDPSYRPVYVPNVADIPALLFYLAAVPIQLFGASLDDSAYPGAGRRANAAGAVFRSPAAVRHTHCFTGRRATGSLGMADLAQPAGIRRNARPTADITGDRAGVARVDRRTTNDDDRTTKE